MRAMTKRQQNELFLWYKFQSMVANHITAEKKKKKPTVCEMKKKPTLFRVPV